MALLTFNGHSTFTVDVDDGTRLVIDPWFDGNSAADRVLDQVVDVDYVLCTHGHSDHFADAIPLAKRTGATLISTFEIVKFAGTKGVRKVHPMHIGGGYDFPFGRVKMTPALHGGQVHGDTTGQFTTLPGGFLLHVDGTSLYHTGDTALTTDMTLLEGRVDVALLCIGDNFTMGPADAVRAVEMIKPKVVVPHHYNTFDLIRQDAGAFRDAVGDRAVVEIMNSGDRLRV